MAWQTVLTDLSGTVLSHLTGATDREVAIPVSSMATAKIVIPLEHDDADLLLDCRTLLKVYETLDDDASKTAAAAARSTAPGPTITGDRMLHFVGRQITAEESTTAGSRPTIAATFADPMWTLMRRHLGNYLGSYEYSYASAAAPADIGTIIADILFRAHEEDVAESVGWASGALMGTVVGSSSTYVAGWYAKPAAEGIAELCSTLGGPDWKIRAIEPVDPGNSPPYAHGRLDVLPSIGQHRANAVFEYGDGALNVSGYRRTVSLEGAANRTAHLPPGAPENAAQLVMRENDTTAQGRDGLLEAIVSADVAVDDLRRKLLQHHIAIRKNPRQIITFDPVRDPAGDRVPRLGIDFDVGDTIPFRASVMRWGALVKRVNITARIYQCAIKIDDEGAADTTLTITPS